MKQYNEMTQQELQLAKEELLKEYKKNQDLKLNLNMTRGKPCPQQLDMCMPMFDELRSRTNCIDKYGVDCRNYGELLGIREARELFGSLMGTTVDETIVVGASSLTFMYDCVSRAMLKGVLGSERPWVKEEKVKFLCPVPGYDRHFTICEFLGIEMINIELTEWGPDMDAVRKYVENDPQVKGMWCVPKYSNPYGSCYSDECVKQLAALKPAAPDFRIFWDNAYMVHTIYEDIPVLNILDECKKAGNPNMVYMFGSTSKITMAGSGIAFFGASEENVKFTEKQIKAQAISWDKINMLLHVRFLKDAEGVKKIMQGHAEILRPKFDAVLETLDKNLTGKGAGRWIKPHGGYFVTYIGNKGTAKRIHQLCKEAGVVLTEAGATHPYHMDPDDAYLRIAPSYPSLDEIYKAMEIFTIAAQIATIEALEN